MKALKVAAPEEKTRGVLCRYGLRHLKEIGDEDHVYAFPRQFVSTLRPLNEALAPKYDLINGAGGLQGDDGFDLESCYSKNAHTSPLLCFRIIHREPKRRKVHIPATNELRTDMIAVAVCEVTNRNRRDRSLVVQSTMEDESSQIRLLSAESFLTVGMDRLKAMMVESALTDEAHTTSMVFISRNIAKTLMAGQWSRTWWTLTHTQGHFKCGRCRRL